MIQSTEKVRVEQIQELNFYEVQFLAFIKDSKTFPRKIISKIHKFGKDEGYTYTYVRRKHDCLNVTFGRNGLPGSPNTDVDLTLLTFDGKIHLVKSGRFGEVHPSIEAFLDVLTYIQDLKGTVEEIEVIRRKILDMKYDLLFGIGCSTMKAITSGEVTDIYILIGNIYIRFTQKKYCSTRFLIGIGVFYITCLTFNKIYDNNN